MKALNLIVIALFGMIISSCTANVSQSVYPYYGYSCNCTDPACRLGNACLSAADCCRVFGNIGGTCFDQLRAYEPPPTVMTTYGVSKHRAVYTRPSYKGESYRGFKGE